jgi:hypothetical protein
MAVDQSKQAVGFAIEPTWSTFTAPTQFVPFEGVTVKENVREERDSTVVYGVSTTHVDNVSMLPDGVGGGFVGPLPDRGFTMPLMHITMGSRVTTALGGGYTRDVYSFSDGGPSATIQTLKPRSSRLAGGAPIEDVFSSIGCMIDTFTLTGAVGKALKFDAQWMGKREFALPAEVDGMGGSGSAGVFTGTVAGALFTTNTEWIVPGMTVYGGGFAPGTTVLSIAGGVATMSGAGTAGTQKIRIGFPASAPSFPLARVFRANAGKVVITVDRNDGAGPLEYCFSEYTLTIGNSLAADERFCGKEQAQRNAPRTVGLSFRGGLYDLVWRDLLFGNHTIGVKIENTSTYDEATKFNLAASAVKVKSPTGVDLSSQQLKLVQDVDLEILAPTVGQDLVITHEHL